MPMSFSSDVKAELAEYIAEARHCLFAELSAMLSMSARVRKRKEGYEIQVNKGSVTGRFGRTFCEVANELLNHNLVSVIASDAHGTMARTCEMRDAYKVLARAYDERYLNILFDENPRRICSNLETVRMPIKSF